MATAVDYSTKMDLMGYYTDTTDGAGDIDITLADTPVSVNSIVLFTNNQTLVPKIQGLVGAVLTVRFFKRRYEKVDTTDTDAENLPGGVTKRATKQTTDAFSAPSSGGPGGGPNNSTSSHTHGVSFQYSHSHVISSFAATASTLVAYATQAVTIMVFYNSTP